ncbi:MAG: hypothetical protein QOE84_3047 [Actinomycetota bacterium]|nr:hypothetical protein [Actinomycetota bacterium]
MAIVHERFTEYAGSERVVGELLRVWPKADVFAPIADPSALPPGLHPSRVRTSRLQGLYRGGKTYAHLLPLLPAAMASFDLTGYDLVVTSHHAFANRVRPSAATPLLSYTHTPARWVWEPAMRKGEAGLVGGALLAAFASTQRRPDRLAAARVGDVLANSRAVQQRVGQWWGRESTVVPPPVDVTFYAPDPSVQREDFFLLAGRLVPYKRPEVAAAAAAAAGVRLVVVGEGRTEQAVKEAGGDAVTLLGRVSDDELRSLFRRCRAVLLPGEEDFGIIPVEAQACGAPVIALACGGALDTVVADETGVLYVNQPGDPPAHALAGVLRAFSGRDMDSRRIRRHAERFAPECFRDSVRAAAESLMARSDHEAK